MRAVEIIPAGGNGGVKDFFFLQLFFPSGQKNGILTCHRVAFTAFRLFVGLRPPCRPRPGYHFLPFSLKNKRFTTFVVQMTTVEYSCRLSEKCLNFCCSLNHKLSNDYNFCDKYNDWLFFHMLLYRCQHDV